MTDFCRWIFLFFCLTTWTKYTNSKEIRVVCYYTNWSVYRPGTAKFSPQNINPYLCTHLIYAFGGFTKENTLKPFDKYQDIEKGGYAKFTGLKTYNKNLKTMLAIGGWNEGSSRFSPMVANSERRKELIKNTIKFLRQNHFDGLDLDWEYPSFRDGGKSRDRNNYAQLVQEIREEFERESDKTGRPRLLLTMAVPAGIEYVNKGYDVPKLTKYLDWMNILSYDYHSAFEPAVNHHAPLYSLEEPSEYNYDTELNIDYTIQYYLKNGADPNKLVLGIPTYGRSYTLFNPDANEIGAPADGPGDMGEATRENGYLAYYEICEYIKTQDWEVVQPDPDAMGPYAYKDNQWVGYDDDAIARKKAAYVAENNLGGIMFWSIDNDDFRGNCHGKPFPIIEAAKEALISAYGLTDDNLVSPPSKPTKSKPRTRTRTQSLQKSSIAKDEDNEKKVSSTASRRRNRVKPKSDRPSSSNRAKARRKESRGTTEETVYSSLELVTPSYTTPAPPPTPDMGGEFKCEDEGFYPHPKDCKKYFWCLSGAGELGIIAHQFTCPAGLYFNKAADSCDYTRNVLCNKKLSKSTTTTTTQATTSKTSATTTSRTPPKITAASSRTTLFRTSTTTEAYDDEYEYEDEEDEEENANSEEDPRVIKELLDLIKKAGGIEELEKQLKVHEDGSASVPNPDATTPSSISKSLVERVLGKAAKNKNAGRKTSYSFINRNSRGPQNEGIQENEDKEKPGRGRPQYTTISRQRAQKADDIEDDEGDEQEETSKKYAKKQPEYVNIRRGRVSSTTEEPEENSRTQINRNKILGENDDDDVNSEETDNEDEEEPVSKKSVIPQYVNIRRQRPSTTEDTSTSKYTVIRRGSTTEADTTDEALPDKKRESTTPSIDDVTTEDKQRNTTIAGNIKSTSTEKTDIKSKYKILRRGSTTESPEEEESASTLSPKRRGTTPQSLQDVSEKTKTRSSTSTTSSSISTVGEKYKILKRGSTTEASTQETISDDSTNKNSSASQTSSPETQEIDVINTETQNPVTETDQLLITSPESLTVKTTVNINSTNQSPEKSKTGSILTNSSDGTVEGVYQTQTPLLLDPRPFSLSTNGPASSVKPVTEPTTRVTKVSESNYKLRVRTKPPNTQTDIISTTTLTTEKPTPFRAPSRYKQTTSSQSDIQTTRATLKPSVRSRKRFSTTTEQYSDNYEEYDLNRTFRPSELADLSSLTAVDFSAFKDLNRFGNPSRQRRPRPSTASTTTATQKPEESLKTTSRTLPLARKFLNGATFGKGRRVITNKNESEIEDQINSSSDTTQKIRPFTRVPPTLSTVASTEETTRQTLRNRKIIRRLRPTTSSLHSQNADKNQNQITFKKRLVRPSSTTPTETENLIENASSNSLFSRRFTKPTISTARKISKLSTTTEVVQKTTTQLPKEDDDQNETSDDVSVEEGENIRLSESNIRDNVLNAEDGKKVRKKILKRIRSKVDDEKITTEPNVIIRTRKIIRKLTPTEASLTLSTISVTEPTEVSTQGRKRKIIRRLRPTTASTSPTLSTTEKTLFIRGRPFVAHADVTDSKESEIQQQESPVLKHESGKEETISKSEITKSNVSPFKSKYKTITRTTPPSAETEDAEDEDEHKENEEEHSVSSLDKTKFKTFGKTTTKPSSVDSYRTIDRSKYGTLNRGTTSTTTTKYNADIVDEENDEEVEEVNKQSHPRYRIYRPTTFHDDAEDTEDGEEDDEDTKSLKQSQNPTLSIGDINEEISKEAIKIRILRPSSSSQDANNGSNVNDEDIKSATDLNVTQEVTKIYGQNENEGNVPQDQQANLTDSTDKQVEGTTEKSEALDNKQNESPENTENEQKKDEDEQHSENEHEESTESDEDNITTTTTVRNYVNPILSRQKNRPAFVRPKLATQSPLQKSSVSKPKYRSFSRPTTSRPSKIIHVVTEEIIEDKHQELDKKFVPKSLNRTRYLAHREENVTEYSRESTSQESIDELSVNNNNTNDFYNATTELNDVLSSSTENEGKTEADEITTSTESNDRGIYNTTIFDEDNVSEENLTIIESTTNIPQTIYEFTDANNVTYTENTSIYENNVTYSENSSTYENNVTYFENASTFENNVTQNEFDNVINNTAIYNATDDVDDEVTLEVTTLRTYDNVELVNETTASYNFTSTVTTDENPIDTTLVYNYSQSTTVPTESQTNETTADYTDTSIISKEITTTETTPVYSPKSTLRSVHNRPKYHVPKRLTPTENTGAAGKTSRRFNQRNRVETKPRLISPNLRSTTPSVPTKNRFIYKYSTTERSRFVTKEQDNESGVNGHDNEDFPEDNEGDVEKELEEQVHTTKTSTHPTPIHRPTNSKVRISNRPEGYSFRKTTETPKVNEELSDIDTEAVRNRNKNLFSKRKMNTPFSGHAQDSTSSEEGTDSETSEKKPTTETSEEKSVTETSEEKSLLQTPETTTTTNLLTTTPTILESVTKPTEILETTELYTTLHHVFAQSEQMSDKTSTTETTTAAIVESSRNSKVEKLIEVNRIVEVHDKNETIVQKDNKFIDKVGVINRVTVVKVVDGNPSLEENEITETTPENVTTSKGIKADVDTNVESEIATVKEQPSERQNRKFEVYGVSKLIDYNSKNGKTIEKGNAEIIDGISHINIITPRPYYSTEAATISLEGLFQTPKSSNDDELLETGNSRYVNIRILGQGENGDKEINDESQIVPIRVPKEEDYITMKAEVVEVTPKISRDVIKIVPIQVEMSRKLIFPSDFNMKVESGLPRVNFQIIKSENK